MFLSASAEMLTKCQNELKEQRTLRDELEMKMAGGEEVIQQQVRMLIFTIVL